MRVTDKVFLRELGQHLRAIRLGKGLILDEVSGLSNLSVPYLSDVERGKCNPSALTLAKIGEAYNLSLSELFAGFYCDEIPFLSF